MTTTNKNQTGDTGKTVKVLPDSNPKEGKSKGVTNQTLIKFDNLDYSIEQLKQKKLLPECTIQLWQCFVEAIKNKQDFVITEYNLKIEISRVFSFLSHADYDAMLRELEAYFKYDLLTTKEHGIYFGALKETYGEGQVRWRVGVPYKPTQKPDLLEVNFSVGVRDNLKEAVNNFAKIVLETQSLSQSAKSACAVLVNLMSETNTNFFKVEDILVRLRQHLELNTSQILFVLFDLARFSTSFDNEKSEIKLVFTSDQDAFFFEFNE